MTVGQRIKELRKSAGYSRVALAEKMGMPQTTLRNYENDDREPGHTFLIAIANEFSVSVDYLLGLEPKEQKNKAPTEEEAAEALYTFLYYQLGERPKPEEINAFSQMVPIICRGIKGIG